MLLIKQLIAFRPSKTDWMFASKTFVAALLALYIAFSLDLAYPVWAMGTVFIIANPYAGMNASKSVYRVLGTCLGAVVSIVVTPHLLNIPELFTVCLALWVGFCLYISLLDRTPRSYIFMLAGYTTVIICYNIVYNAQDISIFDMAIGRCIEISLGVLCSAVVNTVLFPMPVAPLVKARATQTFKDALGIFEHIVHPQHHIKQGRSTLSQITRDIAETQVMLVHLSYEKSSLKKMAQPIQESLYQLSLLLTHLATMSERIQQLDQIDLRYRQGLELLHQDVLTFLQAHPSGLGEKLSQFQPHLEMRFQEMFDAAVPAQQVILDSLHHEMFQFIQRMCLIQWMWTQIEKGNHRVPFSLTSKAAHSARLHRDHGVAIRGGVSASIAVLVATTFWIMTGWHAGFMMAEMTAVSACILTAIDNPVPALKTFIRGSVYASIIVFIYAYGVFPYLSEFWMLGLALAPFCIYCLMLLPHPPLTGLALPVIMGVIMGLNLHNRYHLDYIMFFDAAIGTILGPIIAVYVIHLVRAMSPDVTAERILSLHYQAIQHAVYMKDHVAFNVHLHRMLDRIGVLNSKGIQSTHLKQPIDLVLIESSALVDLKHLHELKESLPSSGLQQALHTLQGQIEAYFQAKASGLSHIQHQQNILCSIQQIQTELPPTENPQILRLLNRCLYNIQTSLLHVCSISRPQQQLEGTSIWEK